MKTIKELINENLIWLTKNVWYRKCPKCNSDIKYIDKYKAGYAYHKRSICKECTKNIISEKLKNHIVLFKTKQKISNSLKGNIPWNKDSKGLQTSWIKGKFHSDETKKKLSQSHKGRISNRKGIKLSEETKRKCRIAHIERLNKLGIKYENKDYGSDEFFKCLNNIGICNFKQECRIKELGYIVDGFDEKHRIILEYDSPYHKKPCQKIKDEIRQNNILNYFDKINNPISYFIRVNASNKKLNAFYVHRIVLNLILS